MNTAVLPADSPQAIQRALEILRAGGLVAFPTDTVYGLGALAFDARAIESIYAAKHRPVEKAIPILIGEARDLTMVAAAVPTMAAVLARNFWPGPLTLVVPKHPDLPESISATATVGVRVPDHPLARALLRAAGAMAVTSANLSGQASPSSAAEIVAQLGGRVPMVLDGGATPGGIASTVVDCTGPLPVILREGPIQLSEIQAALAREV